MESVRVHIKTREEAFGTLLQEVLVRNYRGFVVSLEVVDEERGARIPADVILCDEEDLCDEGDVLLVERPSEEVWEEEKDLFRLFRYTDAPAMIDRILAICSLRRGRMIYYSPEGREAELFVVLSAHGGSGVTTISRALAKELAGRAKVLWLTASQIPEEIGTGDGVTLRDLLFVGCGNDFADWDEMAWGRALVQDTSGVMRIRLPKGENPLLGLTYEATLAFLSLVSRSGRFDYLVADGGAFLTHAVCALAEAADRLLFLRGEGERDRQFLRLLEQYSGRGTPEKLWSLKNYCLPPSEDAELERKVAILYGYGAEEEEAVFRIPRDPEAFEGSRDARPDSLFSAAIAKMTIKILKN